MGSACALHAGEWCNSWLHTADAEKGRAVVGLLLSPSHVIRHSCVLFCVDIANRSWRLHSQYGFPHGRPRLIGFHNDDSISDSAVTRQCWLQMSYQGMPLE